MKWFSSPRRRWIAIYATPLLALSLMIWGESALSAGRSGGDDGRNSDHSANAKNPVPRPKGNVSSGRYVFQFETFGDEGFWTDAARMPQGMKAAKITPMDALRAGMNVDAERIPFAVRRTLKRELKTDLSAKNAPALNDPATTEKLVKAGAFIGVVPRNGKVGVACALCHTITDASVFALPGGKGGSIGRRIDGPTPHFLNVGRILSWAANSRALYPILQHQKGDATIGRAPKGLTPNSTEAEVDAYLNNPAYFPIGTFDDTPDGIGNSVHIPPLFRQDLSAPYGISGQNAVLDDFCNTVCTVLFDQTPLATPGGEALLTVLGGEDGKKISQDYARILKETGVTGYPYVRVATTGQPGMPGTPVGLRVDNQKLLDLDAYLFALPAPKGVQGNRAAMARGRELFRANCTQSCHNIDQSKSVSPALIPMTRIFPGYEPTVLAQRQPPLVPIQNAPGTFDDKMVVIDASPGGGIRGNALPLLLDLARKPVFLHDDSVPSLSSLLGNRGAKAPHPFYIQDTAQRADVVTFLRSLDTRAAQHSGDDRKTAASSQPRRAK